MGKTSRCLNIGKDQEGRQIRDTGECISQYCNNAAMVNNVPSPWLMRTIIIYSVHWCVWSLDGGCLCTMLQIHASKSALSVLYSLWTRELVMPWSFSDLDKGWRVGDGKSEMCKTLLIALAWNWLINSAAHISLSRTSCTKISIWTPTDQEEAGCLLWTIANRRRK